MTDKFMVSQSKVKTFRRCHMAYHLRYVRKLRKKTKSRALQFGTIIHEMLERYINAEDPFEYLDELEQNVQTMKLFAQEREEYGDILSDCRAIITDYMDYWDAEEIIFMRKKRRSAEFTFEIEIIPDVVWNGKIDAIGVTPNKLRWLVEHKTYSRRPSDDDRWRNLQSVTYFRANDILGWPALDGCLWDYVKSKPPAIPGLLKDESLSQKRIDTLPAVVYQLLDQREESPDQYPQLIKMAEENRSQYFHRVHTPVNRSVADLVFEDFENTIKRMVDQGESCRDRNIDRHCGWCDYEAICRAELQGLDVDYVIEREYDDGKSKKGRKAKDDEDEKPPVFRKDFSEIG